MMKQPYSCWLEVPEGVRWNRKRSPEPNLHVCGEDDTKRVVYNMKEGIEGKDLDFKIESTEKKTIRKKELNLFQREIDRYIRANPSINVKKDRFSFGVNLVL